MNQKLIIRAKELRNRGFTTGEIADELNVSIDTARWLTMQNADKAEEEKEEAPIDFAINWNSLGGSSTRLRYVSAAMADMALTHGESDIVMGIAVSGVPFATMMSDVMEAELGNNTSLAVFHPIKHRKDEEGAGAISTNFANVKGKKVVIVDDVITSGRTMKDIISVLKQQDATPLAVVVLIDKKGISEIEGVPVESLIKVGRLG